MSKELGILIKNARTEKKLTQAQLAAMVDGLTARDISDAERGTKEPSKAAIRGIAKALGVTQASLLAAADGSGGKTGAASGKASASAAKKKKTSASSSDADQKLTAAEKKLVRLYRKADAQTRKTAVALLEGTAGAGDLIGALLAGKTGSASSSQSSAQTGEIGDLIGSLLGGKAENAAAASGGDGNLLSSLLEGMLGKTGK